MLALSLSRLVLAEPQFLPQRSGDDFPSDRLPCACGNPMVGLVGKCFVLLCSSPSLARLDRDRGGVVRADGRVPFVRLCPFGG